LLGSNLPSDGEVVAFFLGWKTLNTIFTKKIDWLCMIGKNGGLTSNIIMANGVSGSNNTGGASVSLPNLTDIPYANVMGKPATFPADMTHIYPKSETNALLNTTRNTLNFSTPLNIDVSNNVTFDLSAYV
jgi:hypothetical protein